MRAAGFVLAGVLVVLVLGVSAPSVRAAGPTLRIVSPADHAVIGNGSSVPVIFVVSDFNLTPPGTGGPGPPQTEGHVDVYVDGLLTVATSQETIELPLASGTYTILLRLVSDNETFLNPDVTSSISVTVTQGPAAGTPRIHITYVEITYPTAGLVLGRDVTISFNVTDFALVPPGRGASVPNEGHVAVFLNGVYYMAVMAFRPIPFSDLVDGDYNVTVQLVNDGGRPLTPDASDSVNFRIQFAAIVDINPYLQITQIILAGAILAVFVLRGCGRHVVAMRAGRIGEKNRGGPRKRRRRAVRALADLRPSHDSDPARRRQRHLAESCCERVRARGGDPGAGCGRPSDHNPFTDAARIDWPRELRFFPNLEIHVGGIART